MPVTICILVIDKVSVNSAYLTKSFCCVRVEHLSSQSHRQLVMS